MNQSIFTEIPEGFVIQLFGPVENSWCCELFNQDHTIEIQKYGDSAEMAVQACLTRLQKVRHPVTRSRIAHLPTNLSASRLRKIQIG
ncbi:hypothetical protein [Dyadobacter frigoris]|uniref:Uncharacterized protein n=1 Tax=Dyadobacter frigoris TaxID=2576211 RepID=A0A4U6DAB6_9BACT|nr:hypothetical protein [Dyadobacter frigoris]TKT93331.1 hypothetical protein FDK13_05625 [Dyadobacter frigoris]